MPIRRGAHTAKVENSGLVVFLYDAANAHAIAAASPQILSGFSGKRDLDDPKLRDLPVGTLVAYELRQDDPIHLEVVTGNPLTPSERKGRWLDPQRTRLVLPTGKLHVEGYDALGIGPEQPAERGAVVNVDPGDYVLSLYRRGDAGESGTKGPNEVVVLTPLAAAEPVTAPRSVLRIPAAEPAAGSDGGVTAGTFRGRTLQTLAGNGAVASTMTRDHARELALGRGQRLDVQLFGLSRGAVWLGSLNPHDRWSPVILGADLVSLRAASPPAIGAWLQQVHSEDGDDTIERVVIGGLDPARNAETWIGADPKDRAIMIRATTERTFTPPDDAPLLEPAVEGGVVRPFVLASGSDRMLLGAPASAFEACGVKAGDHLVLATPRGERRMVWGLVGGSELVQIRREFEQQFAVKLSDDPALTLPEKLALRKKQEADALERMTAAMPLLAYHAPHWDDGDRAVLYCKPLVREEKRPDLGLAMARGERVSVHRAPSS